MNKYHAKRVQYDGITFDSKAERDRYIILKLMQKNGEIYGLDVHPKYEFTINGRPVLTSNGRKATFKPDFRYIKPGFGIVIEDVKGVVTEAYRVRKAFFEALYHPAKVIEIPAKQKRKKPARWKRRPNAHRETRVE